MTTSVLDCCNNHIILGKTVTCLQSSSRVELGCKNGMGGLQLLQPLSRATTTIGRFHFLHFDVLFTQIAQFFHCVPLKRAIWSSKTLSIEQFCYLKKRVKWRHVTSRRVTPFPNWGGRKGKILRRRSVCRRLRSVASGFRAVWPDLSNFRHFGKSLPVFGKFLTVHLLLGKILSWRGQIFGIIGLIFIIANGQILKNNLSIWPHWFRVTPSTSFSCCQPTIALNCLSRRKL